MAAHCMTQLVVPEQHDEWSLIGWSFGGVLAYETARQLAESGSRPRRLVLIDTYLPPLRGQGVDPAEATAGPFEQFAGFDAWHLQHVVDPELLRSAGTAQIIAAHGNPAASDFDAVRRTCTSNLAALHHYRPTRHDVFTIEIRAERTPSQLIGNGYAPRTLPATPRRVIVLPGDHYSIMSEESHGQLANAVDEALR
jgi:thioesterase domain-containing protein